MGDDTSNIKVAFLQTIIDVVSATLRSLSIPLMGLSGGIRPDCRAALKSLAET